MSHLQSRGSFAGAAVLVALLSSRMADAQIVYDPGPPRQQRGLVNDIVTGIQYDVVNQAKAEQNLQIHQDKLPRDSANGRKGLVNHDIRRINNLKYRIAVDQWLIRQNSVQPLGRYPYLTDEVSCAALAAAARPAEYAYPPQLGSTPAPVAPPTIPITVVNAEATGPGVGFAVGGTAYQAAGGSRQELTVAADAEITYDAGGSLGQRRYQVAPGVYEFRSTPEGWALYKLPDKP